MTRGAGGSPTGPAATLGRIWAVARLTLKEAVRRKVFILLLLFGVAIVSSAAFFPAIDAEGRLRLIEIWSVRAALFFSVIVSIFLAGFSLPSDFETRRVYTLVTKPLRKVTLFLGKFLGFFLLLVAFLGLMAAISVAYIRLVSSLSDEFPPLKADPRYPASRFTAAGPHHPFEEAGRIGVLGFEGGSLVWQFRGLRRDLFGDRLKVRLRANLMRIGSAYALEGDVVVRAVNPETRFESRAEMPPLQTNRETFIEFDGRAMSDAGAVDIVLAGGEPALGVDADAGSVVLYGSPWNFDVNYFKGMMLVLFQSVLVMSATLAVSTRFSAPVSIFLGLAIYVVGVMWGHVHEGAVEIDLQLKQFRAQLAQGQATARPPEDLPPWLLEGSVWGSRLVLGAIPDFSRYSFGDLLLTDHAVMARDLAGGFLSMASRVAVFLVLGLLLITTRDFAA